MTNATITHMSSDWFSEQLNWRLPRNIVLRQWLLLRTSMTTRLQAVVGGRLSVKILQQSWARPEPDERQLLGLPAAHYCLIREVELSIDGQLLMVARSVLPVGRLTEQYQKLPGLTTKPLGKWLFSQPQLQRSEFQFRQYVKKDSLCQRLAANRVDAATGRWGRRSTFSVPQQKLLLTEVFMPELFR